MGRPTGHARVGDCCRAMSWARYRQSHVAADDSAFARLSASSGSDRSRQTAVPKLGFIDQGLLTQHQCRKMPAGHTAPLPKGASLRPALPQDLATLVELDLAASGLSRQPLLAAMLASAEQALVLEQQGIAVGFAFRRRFGHGNMIGPVVAPGLTGPLPWLTPYACLVRASLCGWILPWPAASALGWPRAVYPASIRRPLWCAACPIDRIATLH